MIFPDTTTGKKDSEEKNSDDKEEHEEVTTLGHMCTRSQTRVSRYYTAAEPIVKDNKKIKEVDLTRDPIENIEKEEPVYSSDPEDSNSEDRDFVD
jgi:hypothetical protein